MVFFALSSFRQEQVHRNSDSLWTLSRIPVRGFQSRHKSRPSGHGWGRLGGGERARSPERGEGPDRRTDLPSRLKTLLGRRETMYPLVRGLRREKEHSGGIQRTGPTVLFLSLVGRDLQGHHPPLCSPSQLFPVYPRGSHSLETDAQHPLEDGMGRRFSRQEWLVLHPPLQSLPSATVDYRVRRRRLDVKPGFVSRPVPPHDAPRLVEVQRTGRWGGTELRGGVPLHLTPLTPHRRTKRNHPQD